MIGETDRAREMDALTVFEAKMVRTGEKRKREDKGDPGEVDGYKGPWRGYVDQVTVSKPTEEEKATLELMFASKKKVKKEEELTIEESTLLHGEYRHILSEREGGREGGGSHRTPLSAIVLTVMAVQVLYFLLDMRELQNFSNASWGE